MRFYEVEYRRTPLGDGTDVVADWLHVDARTPESEGSVRILDLELDERYDVRTRLVDEAGAFSEWVTYTAILVEKDGGVPPAPSQVRLTKNDCLTWEMPMEVLDLRGFRVRHMPCAWEVWGTAEPAHEEYVDHPPFLLCRVPKGRRTFLVTAVDWDGNESAPTLLVADRGPLDDQAEFSIRTRDEAALAFPATLKGAPAGSVLLASLVAGAAGTQPAFGAGVEPCIPLDGAAPAIPYDPKASVFCPVWGGDGFALDRRGSAMAFGEVQYQWIEYVWEFEAHCGEEGPRSVLTADVTIVSVTSGFPMPWRLQYRRECQLPAIPVDPFAAAIPVDGTAEAFPIESPREWRPWPGRLLGVQPGVYEFRLLVPGGREQVKVTACSVRVSSEPQVLHVAGLSVPALGGTRVPPGSLEWRKIVEVTVEPYGTQALRQVPRIDANPNKGPWLQAFDAAGAQVTQTVDATLRGY